MTAAAPRLPSAATDLDALVVAPSDAGAYQWWYFDALSDDGRFGLVAIYFVGGVFSAHYADRIAAGEAASPFDHPMVNLALYDRAKRISWVFSEYPRRELVVGGSGLALSIAGSGVTRGVDGSYALHVSDMDFTRNRPVDLRATFRPTEGPVTMQEPTLDARGRHFWGSPAPLCDVSVECPSLGLRWSGHGYHDVNSGREPLHAGFRHWSWGRANVGGRLQLYYDAVDIDGVRSQRIRAGESWVAPGVPDVVPMGLTPWLLRAPRRVTAGALQVAEERRWESSPFYLRTVGRFRTPEGEARGVCEHVDLQRFASPFVRSMLRYRIYRRGSRTGAPLPKQADWKSVVAAERGVGG